MAAPSQTLPMVDGEWGGLQDHSITSIGYHLVFRAGGLRARSDTLSAAAESGTRRRGFAHFQRERGIAMQNKTASGTHDIVVRATSFFFCIAMPRSLWKFAKPLYVGK